MDELEYLYYRLGIPYEHDGYEQEHLFAYEEIVIAELIYEDAMTRLRESPPESPNWVIDTSDDTPA
jgi:hypothetical protein